MDLCEGWIRLWNMIFIKSTFSVHAVRAADHNCISAVSNLSLGNQNRVCTFPGRSHRRCTGSSSTADNQYICKNFFFNRYHLEHLLPYRLFFLKLLCCHDDPFMVFIQFFCRSQKYLCSHADTFPGDRRTAAGCVQP